MNVTNKGFDGPSLAASGRHPEDPAYEHVVDTARRVASTPATVMLLGESGTGKSVLARQIHQASPRRSKRFVTVSCPSLSDELLESELFGHRRGAFTGAVRDHWGKVAAAEAGTLLLDEIGDLPAAIQPKLLRLLQEREYERVGSATVHRADVRIIAATNRDLREQVADGAFREDLYYRLHVVALELPPLRERPLALRRAAERILAGVRTDFARPRVRFSTDARSAIHAHSWPGNFRELQNAIQRAVVNCRNGVIEPSDLGLRDDPPAPVPEVGSHVSLSKLEATHIREVMKTTSTLAQAASVLGIDNSTLFRKRRQYAI